MENNTTKISSKLGRMLMPANRQVGIKPWSQRGFLDWTGGLRTFAWVIMATLLSASGVHGQQVLYTFDGDSPGDFFGRSVSGAGDVNGDGFDDFVVGASGDSNNGSNSGSARVFSGQDGSILYTFSGDAAGDLFGFSVSGAGDVNGDGFADLIVGAPGDDNNGTGSGSARVFSGQNGSILYTFNGDSAGDEFGFSVSGAGDLDDDGFADLIIGAPEDDNNGRNSGSARVFSGQDGSILYTWNGDAGLDRFGGSVSGAGDVNGDGFADLIVGAYGNDTNGDGSGSARVFSGQDGSILYTFYGPPSISFGSGPSFGASVSGAGDVNGDGFADLIVGAPSDDINIWDSGSVQVLSGQDGSILYTFNGDSVESYFGLSVSGAGDVNGDGFADFIVGAPSLTSDYSEPGYARVFSGRDGSILYSLSGDLGYDAFGGSVSGAGDVNGDGLADLIVGAWGDDHNGTDSGSARVFAGAPGPVGLINNLLLTVAELNLANGIDNSLDAKLGAALNALDDLIENNDQAACGSLQAFITAVEAQRGGLISNEDADLLVDMALDITQLICP